jgi:hypothetical protein
MYKNLFGATVGVLPDRTLSGNMHRFTAHSRNSEKHAIVNMAGRRIQPMPVREGLRIPGCFLKQSSGRGYITIAD